jgi:hypothetical protein
MNKLIANANQSQGLAQAIITATNRRSGAFDAGDAESATMQGIIESQYALDLSKLLAAEPALAGRLGSTLKQAGFPSSISVQSVQAYQASVATNGLPPYEVQALQQLGVDANTINAITQGVAALDPTSIAGSVPGIFNNANVKSTVQSGVDALVAVAASHNVVALASGQKISGSLTFTNANGSPVVISISATGYTSSISGTFTLTDKSLANPQKVYGKIKGASLENGSVIVDGTYTDSNGAPQFFTAVATIRGTSATINNVTLALSSGYAAAGTVTSGSLNIS